MNPQIKYGELNKQAWEALWDNMPSWYKKMVSAGVEPHATKFAQLVKSDTDYYFTGWENAQTEDKWPVDSNEYLNGILVG